VQVVSLAKTKTKNGMEGRDLHQTFESFLFVFPDVK
jgi:hypothetical protein